MPEEPTNGTLLRWMTRIDERLEGIEGRLIDKDSYERLEGRVDKIEEKTSNLTAKQAGLAGTITGIIIGIKHFFTGV